MEFTKVDKIKVWGVKPPKKINHLFNVNKISSPVVLPVDIGGGISPIGQTEYSVYVWTPKFPMEYLGNCSPSDLPRHFYRIENWVFSIYAGFYEPPSIQFHATPEGLLLGNMYWAKKFGITCL